MATVTADQAKRSSLAVPTRQIRGPRTIGRFLDRWFLPAFTALAIAYLLIPIAVMILFSFNDYQGKFNFIWNGFTLEAWLHPLDWQGLPEAIRTSITIAFLATVFATVL